VTHKSDAQSGIVIGVFAFVSGIICGSAVFKLTAECVPPLSLSFFFFHLTLLPFYPFALSRMQGLKWFIIGAPPLHA
jgi:hypothetical protein